MFWNSKSNKHKIAITETTELENEEVKISDIEIKPYDSLKESDSDSSVTHIINTRKKKEDKTSVAGIVLEQTPAELQCDETFTTETYPGIQLPSISGEKSIDLLQVNEPDKANSPLKKKSFLQKVGSLIRGRRHHSNIEKPTSPPITLNDTQPTDHTELLIVQPCGNNSEVPTENVNTDIESQYDIGKALDIEHIVEHSVENSSTEQTGDVSFDLRPEFKQSFIDDMTLKADLSQGETPIGYELLFNETIAENSYLEDSMDYALLKSESSSEAGLSLSEVILYEKMTTMPGVRVVKPLSTTSSAYTISTHVAEIVGSKEDASSKEDSRDSSAVDETNMFDISSNMILYKSVTSQRDLDEEDHSQTKEDLVKQLNALKEQYNALIKVMDDTENSYKQEIDTIQANNSVVQDNYVRTLKHNEELTAKIQAAEFKISDMKSQLEAFPHDKEAKNLELFEAKNDLLKKFADLAMQARENDQLFKEDYVKRLTLKVSKYEEELARHDKRFIKYEKKLNELKARQEFLKTFIDDTRVKYESQIKKLKTEINNYKRAEQETHRAHRDQMTNYKEELKQCIEKAKEDAARFWEKKHNKEMDALRNEMDEVHKKTVDDLNAKIKDNNVSRAQQIEAFQAERLKNESLQKQQIEQLEENRVQQAKLHLEMKKKYEEEKAELEMTLKSAEHQYQESLHQEAILFNALKESLIEEHRNEVEAQILQHKIEIAMIENLMATENQQLKMKYTVAIENLEKLDVAASEKQAAVEMEQHLMSKVQEKDDEIISLKIAQTKDQEQLMCLKDKIHVLENELVHLSEQLSDTISKSPPVLVEKVKPDAKCSQELSIENCVMGQKVQGIQDDNAVDLEQ